MDNSRSGEQIVCSPIVIKDNYYKPLDRNDKKLQQMHDMERNGALMCAALIVLSMLVVISFVVLWLIV